MAANPPRPPVQYQRKNTRVEARMGEHREVLDTNQERVVGLDEHGVTVTDTLRVCASCRSVFHKPEEAGAVCGVCDQLVCAKCAKRRCDICGMAACQTEMDESVAGRVCANHGFFAKLRFVLSKALR